jgi:hypothetical protein
MWPRHHEPPLLHQPMTTLNTVTISPCHHHHQQRRRVLGPPAGMFFNTIFFCSSKWLFIVRLQEWWLTATTANRYHLHNTMENGGSRRVAYPDTRRQVRGPTRRTTKNWDSESGSKERMAVKDDVIEHRLDSVPRRHTKDDAPWTEGPWSPSLHFAWGGIFFKLASSCAWGGCFYVYR